MTGSSSLQMLACIVVGEGVLGLWGVLLFTGKLGGTNGLVLLSTTDE